MSELENIYYEDFHELYFMAYKQANTEQGQRELEAENMQDQIEELADSGYGPTDMGRAIQDAVTAKSQRQRQNQRPVNSRRR